MNDKNLARSGFRLSTPVRLGVAAVTACFVSIPALSNPTNPTVVNGTASFNQAGKVLNVTNSNGAIINWNTFSIGAGETTRFIQTSASSSVLNRVLSNNPSLIYGTLTSNGRVWLINQSGIMVGAGGVVDVAGFVASTMNLRNEDFLAGRALFQNIPGAGSVVNQGTITTPSGGSVYLIAPNVTNEGLIHSPNGEVILAAGQTVSLIDSGTPGVKVDITGAEGNATNLGSIVAEAGRIGMAGVLVRNSGSINASSVVSKGGRVFLKASGDTLVDGGKLDARSGSGKGGQVDVLGDRVAVMNAAEIDVTGATGGGRIRVGGDFQGKNPDIQNASITYFSQDAVLKADASGTGDGGTVIVWADDTTRAYGQIYARGGGNGGNGGFIETSGHRYLDVEGIRVNASALTGRSGLWLLDPENVSIVHSTDASPDSNFTGVPNWYPASAGSNSILSDYTINQALLGSTSVSVDTSNTLGTGDISFASNVLIDKTGSAGNATLDFNAQKDILVQGTFRNSSVDTLQITFNPKKNANEPGAHVYTGVGQTAVFDGGTGGMVVRVFNGRTWDNAGTVTLNGKTTIALPDIGGYATYHNASTGTLNLNSTAQWSFLSDGMQGAPLLNDGHININGAYGGNGTSWEAQYSGTAGSVLNIAAGKLLSMQNGNQLGGTYNIGTGGTLWLSESHGGARTFNAATINGPGTVQVGNDASAMPVTATLGAGTSVVGATIDITGTMYPGALAYSGTQTFNNATVRSSTGLVLGLPMNASFVGNNTFLSKGDLVVAPGTMISTPGSLTLVAGWDTTTPGSSITGTTDATGLAGITGNLDFGTGANINAGGTMTLKASNNIRLLGGASGGVNVSSVGAQGVYATAQLQVIASSAVSSGSSYLKSQSAQTISANSIDVKAGDGAGIHDSSAQIVAWGNQQISVGTSAVGWINIWSGNAMQDSGSYNNQASITHGVWSGGSFSGNQTITLGNGSQLDIKAGKGSSLLGFQSNECLSGCAGANNSAYIENFFGNMTINTPAGGSIAVTGGSVGNNNWAGIENNTSGTLSLGTSGFAPAITITGGASGGSLGVKKPAYGGGVYYNSNDASISSDGTLNVNANFVALNAPGVAGTYAAAFLGAPVVTVNTVGSVSLQGGAGASASPTILSTPAAIGNDQNTSLTLNIGGNLDLTGGAGNGAMAMIGSLFGTATINISGQSSVSLNSVTTGADRIGSMFGLGGAINIASNVGGTGGIMSLNQGLIKTGTGALDIITLTTNNTSFSQAAGGKIQGRTVAIVTGTGSVTQPVSAVIDATNLIASGNNLSFLGDNTVTNVMLASTGAGGIAYNTMADTHIVTATAATGNIDITALAAMPPATIGIGTITASSGDVSITAERAILDDNGAALNITAANISMASNGGGSAGGLAISADTSTTGSLAAVVVGGAYGGISIRNNSAATPSIINLTDGATAGNRVSFLHKGSDLVMSGAHSFEVFNGGDLAIFAGANMTLNGGPSIVLPSSTSSVLLGADGNMTFQTGTPFALPNNNLGMVAGGIMTIDNIDVSAKNVAATAPTIGGAGLLHATDDAIVIGTSAINIGTGLRVTGTNVFLGGGTLNIDGAGYVKATGGQLEFHLANVVGITGGHLEAIGPTSNITGIVSGDITLDSGAYFKAGNDVNLTMTGAASTISLSNGAYILATNPNSIDLAFSARSSGGILIDGVATTNTVYPGSGFFVVDAMTPATAGSGLHIAYANTVGVVDLCALNPTLCKVADPSDRPGDQDGLVIVVGGKGGTNPGAGGKDDSFGGDEGKDDKDDKDKDKQKPDGGKDGKKDEKSGKKQVAQCT